MTKEKATLEMIIKWLNSNINDTDDKFYLVAQDSADLKEKIELALDPKTTVEQIKKGDL